MSCSAQLIPDPYEWVEQWLDVWMRYMHDDDNRQGAPKKSAGFNTVASGGYRDFAEEFEAPCNQRAIDLINATLEGMSNVERLSVYYMHGLAVFRTREPIEQVYVGARMKIGIRLRAADFT